MKIYILFFLLLISSPCFAQPNSPWQCLDAELQKVRFVPKNNLVCIVGNTGCLLISADSGATWQQPFTGTLNHLRSIDFATPAIGVIVGYGGVISRTTDGGKSWTLVQSPTTNILNSVQFVSASEGFAVGNNGILLHTEDSGLSWQLMDFPYSFSITTISMDSPKTGIIAGDGANFLKTVDGGLHWQTQAVSTMPFGNTIFQDCIRVNGKTYIFGRNFSGDKSVLLSSNDGITFTASEIPFANDIAIVKDSIYIINTAIGISKAGLNTLDFTWVPMYDTTYPVVLDAGVRKNSICFVSESLGLTAGERKFIFRSVNDFDKWKLICYVSSYSYNDPGGSPNIYNVKFLNDSTGYLVGPLRAIYHTTNGGATWLPQRSTSVELYDMYDITFTSSTHGFAVGSNGRNSVVKTTDGGVTFIPNDTVMHGFMQVGDRPKIRFFGESLGFISGSYTNPTKGLINLTYDSGKSWTKRFFDIGFTDGCWVDSTTILLSGGKYYFPEPRPSEGYVVISRDKGATWDSIILPFAATLLGCWATDANNFVATGTFFNSTRGYGLIFRSSDGGRTWTLVDSSDRQTMSSLSFSTSTLGYTISRRLMQTKDGGYTWNAIAENPLDTGYFVRLTALPKGDVVITTAQPNMVLRSKFNEKVLTAEEPKTMIENVASVWLYAPRPVPTTGKVTLNAIWLGSVDISTIRIKLYDMLGIELQDITDSFHTNSGTNTGIVEYDGSKLPTGIYYIEINGGGYRKAVPVIIAR